MNISPSRLEVNEKLREATQIVLNFAKLRPGDQEKAKLLFETAKAARGLDDEKEWVALYQLRQLLDLDPSISEHD